MFNKRLVYWIFGVTTTVSITCILLTFNPYNVFAQSFSIYLPIVTNTNNTGTGEVPFDNFPVPSDVDFSTTTAWTDRIITYFFANGTNDIAGDNEHQAVREAFDVWESESSLDFTEVNSISNADIVISWEDSDNHGDNCPFDADTLAHAFFPPPVTYCNLQRIHFNDQKNWMIAQDINLFDDTYDVMAVALHEIGHAIGLLHNNDSTSIVMYPRYQGHRTLNADDIQGIRSLYPVEKRIFNETSEVGPTLYNFGTARVGWIGSGNQRLNFADSPSGNNKLILSETGIRGLATTIFNGELYVAWSGTDEAHSINLMRSSDGQNFRDKVTFTDTSVSAPALVVFKNQLYLGWTGTDATNRLNLMRSSDGQNFGDKVSLSETSFAGLSLEVYNGQLYVGWTGDDSNHHLNLMRSDDGQSFSDKVILDDTSIAAPSLVAYNSQLYIAWTGVDEGQHLNVMRSSDGLSFSHKVILNETSIASPSLVVSGNELHIAWTGTDDLHHYPNDIGTKFY
ncbi:MAG: matrixin family metalloprotease [Caldilineaceae bacterium]